MTGTEERFCSEATAEVGDEASAVDWCRQELDWLNEEASVRGLTLDDRPLSFETALRLYAPTLYELWRGAK